jgi:hypothetical protein
MRTPHDARCADLSTARCAVGPLSWRTWLDDREDPGFGSVEDLDLHDDDAVQDLLAGSVLATPLDGDARDPLPSSYGPQE